MAVAVSGGHQHWHQVPSWLQTRNRSSRAARAALSCRRACQQSCVQHTTCRAETVASMVQHSAPHGRVCYSVVHPGHRPAPFGSAQAGRTSCFAWPEQRAVSVLRRDGMHSVVVLQCVWFRGLFCCSACMHEEGLLARTKFWCTAAAAHLGGFSTPRRERERQREILAVCESSL